MCKIGMCRVQPAIVPAAALLPHDATKRPCFALLVLLLRLHAAAAAVAWCFAPPSFG